MRIWTKVVIDVDTLRVIESESEWTDDYIGPIAHCGKGSSGAKPDKAYNARMAAIAEENLVMAKEMFNLYKYGVTYDPAETVTLESGETTTLGAQRGYKEEDYVSEMELMAQALKAESELLPSETALRKTQYETGEKLVRARGDVMSSLYTEAMSGVNVDRRIAENRAGIEQAFAKQKDIMGRDLSRMGIDPSSGRGLSMTQDFAIDKAKAMAVTEAGVRREAEDENFKRLASAAGLPL